jgi:hypothetical protein
VKEFGFWVKMMLYLVVRLAHLELIATVEAGVLNSESDLAKLKWLPYSKAVLIMILMLL